MCIRIGAPCGASARESVHDGDQVGDDLNGLGGRLVGCAVAVGGVRGGTAPRQPLPGTREAWPQRVGWLMTGNG